MSRFCAACAGSDSTPKNFLLTCSSCATSYHHRCHKPELTDPLLVALVKATTDAAKGSADNKPTLQTWICAACTSAPIDLTISDSDQDTPAKNRTEVNVVQQDIKRERLKAEELPASLPPRKYNIASTWIHKQHADSQAGDAWDRLAVKNRPRRPRKVTEPPVKPITRQPFVYVAAHWLESRRSTLQFNTHEPK
ncbi:hypothetical protein E4T56_gene17397 [Termitomyces sp. T112]|nr:hypothetical protein E4T56_gene17397 [Termitomyces sp. T112]